MFELRNVTKIYTVSRGVQTHALRGISIRFPARGMVFIIGKSGCGKSTLLHILGGLDRADEGELIVDGVSSRNFRPVDYDYYRNRYVGFIFQEYNLLDHFSVHDNVKLALELQNKCVDDGQIVRILTKVGLEKKENQKGNTLSGGEKQRVAIARALVKEPQVVLADEPTGALDAESGEQVMALLKKLSYDRLVVVVSHDEERAERYADRIIEMRDGTIVSDRVFSADVGGQLIKHTVEQGGRQRWRYSSARLPIRYVCKLGAFSLKVKPLRLAFTVLLSFIAFLCFAMFSTTIFYDQSRTLVETLAAEGRAYLHMSKGYRREQIRYQAGEIVAVTEQTTATGYTAAEVQELVRRYPGAVAFVEAPGGLHWSGLRLSSQKEYFYQTKLNGLALSSASMEWLAGAAPIGAGEIAVSDFVFETLEQGTLEIDGEEVEIGSYADLIGRPLTLSTGDIAVRFTVSGIFQGERVPSDFVQLREDVRNGDVWETPETFYKWREQCAIGFYAVAALNEEGLALCEPLLKQCALRETNFADRFLLNSNELSVFLEQNEQDVSVGADGYHLLSPYADCTGNGLCDLFSLEGERLFALQDDTVAVSPQLYADLIDPLFRAYFVAAGENAAIDENTYIDANLALFNGAGSAKQMLADFATLQEMMERCAIAQPTVRLKGINGVSELARVGGVFYTPKTIGGLYVSDGLFETLYKGKGGDVRYVYETRYVPPQDAPYTAVYIPIAAVEDVVAAVYTTAEDDSTALLFDPLYDAVLTASDTLQAFSQLFLIGGSIFGGFAVLLLFNFIAASISAQKHEIGILRALGVRTADLYRIFLVEGLSVALICVLLCCIAAPLLCDALNIFLIEQIAMTQVQLFTFAPLSAVLVLLCALFAAIASTIIPVAVYARRPPAQGIRA